MPSENRKSSKTYGYAVAVFILIVSIGLIIRSVSAIADQVRYRDNCTRRAQARVMDTEMRTVGRYDRKEYRAVLEFTDADGNEHTAVAEWSRHEYNDNETAEIMYDPSDPTHIYVPGHRSSAERKEYGDAALGALGVLLGLFMAILAHGLFKK